MPHQITLTRSQRLRNEFCKKEADAVAERERRAKESDHVNLNLLPGAKRSSCDWTPNLHYRESNSQSLKRISQKMAALEQTVADGRHEASVFVNPCRHECSESVTRTAKLEHVQQNITPSRGPIPVAVVSLACKQCGTTLLSEKRPLDCRDPAVRELGLAWVVEVMDRAWYENARREWPQERLAQLPTASNGK